MQRNVTVLRISTFDFLHQLKSTHLIRFVCLELTIFRLSMKYDFSKVHWAQNTGIHVRRKLFHWKIRVEQDGESITFQLHIDGFVAGNRLSCEILND